MGLSSGVVLPVEVRPGVVVHPSRLSVLGHTDVRPHGPPSGFRKPLFGGEDDSRRGDLSFFGVPRGRTQVPLGEVDGRERAKGRPWGRGVGDRG